MEAADSDKDSKSSELTIGPSCIQFRLIIVKVEKFQSAPYRATLATFPSSSPPSLLESPRHETSAQLLFSSSTSFPFYPPKLLLSRTSAFVSTSSGLSHDPFASLRFPFFYSVYTKDKFSRYASAIGEQPRIPTFLLFLSRHRNVI